MKPFSTFRASLSLRHQYIYLALIKAMPSLITCDYEGYISTLSMIIYAWTTKNKHELCENNDSD